MYSRLDFWVTTISLLITVYAVGRALWGSVAREREPQPDSIAPSSPRPAPVRPRTIVSMQKRRAPAGARRAARTPPQQHTNHTVHTRSMNGMAHQDAAEPGMVFVAPSQPSIPVDEDAIPPYEAPPQPGPAGDRDAAIRALVAIGWKSSQIADNLKGDRNAVLKRIREIRAQ